MRTGGLSREAGASQVRRPQKEEEHGDHHPGHQDHSDADATVTGGSWQLPKALCVGAVGLGLPEQIDEPPHSMFVRADTFTGVKSSFSHGHQRNFTQLFKPRTEGWVQFAAPSKSGLRRTRMLGNPLLQGSTGLKVNDGTHTKDH